MRVHLAVDEEKRKGVARNHTATHLLQFALRSVLGEHVKQSGSLVEKDRLRFDFTHFEGLDAAAVSRGSRISSTRRYSTLFDVNTEVKDREAAIRDGATALFEEKYGEDVRVVSIDGFSRELCGGTHVRNTGEIGSFTILSESSLASGVRRIEAVTGKGAVEYRRKVEGVARSIAKDLKTDLDSLENRVEAVLAELNAREKEIVRLKDEMTRQRVDEAAKGAIEKDGAKIVTMFVPGGKADDLRKASRRAPGQAGKLRRGSGYQGRRQGASRRGGYQGPCSEVQRRRDHQVYRGKISWQGRGKCADGSGRRRSRPGDGCAQVREGTIRSVIGTRPFLRSNSRLRCSCMQAPPFPSLARCFASDRI